MAITLDDKPWWVGALVGLVLGAAVLYGVETFMVKDIKSSISRAERLGELKGKDYSGQNLQTAEFANTNLEQSNFSNADLRGAVFNGTKMALVNLQGADFSNGIAYLTDFTDADLSDAVLVEAMMLRSTFKGAKIDGADFSNESPTRFHN